VVLVPRCRLMPSGTFAQLISLAQNGGTVLFQDQLPEDVPGFGKLEQHRAELKRALPELTTKSPQLREARIGKGQILVGHLETMLAAAKVAREEACDQPGIRVIRRRDDTGRIYFIANHGTNVLNKWIRLGTTAASVMVMDALSGQTGSAKLRKNAEGTTEVWLWLDPGHSIFLRTTNEGEVLASKWQWTVPGSEQMPIKGPWRIEFREGGPALPRPFETDVLQSWTKSGDPEAERFAGTAVYRSDFDAPPGTGPWILDLGKVCHSARVYLNGEELGRLILPPYRIQVQNLRAGRNQLEVEVTNLSANRIRDLDRHKVPWRLFHDINLVNINYKAFDASNWPVMDSGLQGPVMLQSLKTEDAPE
jgi:hypothetical protein